MEVIEIYPVEESAPYVRVLEERIRRLEGRLAQQNQREQILIERTATLDSQQAELSRLLLEADNMLQEQILNCRSREELASRREGQLDAREDYLVSIQLVQEEAIDHVRGLIIED